MRHLYVSHRPQVPEQVYGRFHSGHTLPLSAMQVPERLLSRPLVSISESARNEVVDSLQRV